MARLADADDYDYMWGPLKWRRHAPNAIRSRRGQAFLRELIEALDAMPAKRLIAGDLEYEGEVCALGSVGIKRGLDLRKFALNDYERIANALGIARPLVQEIEWINDEPVWSDNPERRWRRMREWAVQHLKQDT